MEKSMLPESSEGTRNRVSFKTKSAYVFAVLTVWILWIVYWSIDSPKEYFYFIILNHTFILLNVLLSILRISNHALVIKYLSLFWHCLPTAPGAETAARSNYWIVSSQQSRWGSLSRHRPPSAWIWPRTSLGWSGWLTLNSPAFALFPRRLVDYLLRSVELEANQCRMRSKSWP